MRAGLISFRLIPSSLTSDRYCPRSKQSFSSLTICQHANIHVWRRHVYPCWQVCNCHCSIIHLSIMCSSFQKIYWVLSLYFFLLKDFFYISKERKFLSVLSMKSNHEKIHDLITSNIINIQSRHLSALFTKNQSMNFFSRFRGTTPSSSTTF